MSHRLVNIDLVLAGLVLDASDDLLRLTFGGFQLPLLVHNDRRVPLSRKLVNSRVNGLLVQAGLIPSVEYRSNSKNVFKPQVVLVLALVVQTGGRWRR